MAEGYQRLWIYGYINQRAKQKLRYLFNKAKRLAKI